MGKLNSFERAMVLFDNAWISKVAIGIFVAATCIFLAIYLHNKINQCFDGDLESWEQQIAKAKITEEEFTIAYANAIQERLPNAKLKINGLMEVTVEIDESDSQYKNFLDNIWALCKDLPENRVEICNEYIDNFIESLNSPLSEDELPDPNLIVPVLKDDRFLNSMPPQDDGTKPFFAEEFAGDIWITYAQDLGTRIMYVSESDFNDLGLSLEELQKRAISNLRNQLDEIRRYGEGPLYMIRSGGTYETSLLLIDSIWEKQDELVPGDIVAAVPARDVLLFTGSESVEGLEQMRQAVDGISKQGVYLISKTLLVRKNGKWEVFVSAHGY